MTSSNLTLKHTPRHSCQNHCFFALEDFFFFMVSVVSLSSKTKSKPSLGKCYLFILVSQYEELFHWKHQSKVQANQLTHLGKHFMRSKYHTDRLI